MLNKPKYKYSLKIFLNNGRVFRYHSQKKKRIVYKLQAQKISEVQKYYLKVSYGTITDNSDKRIKVINEGEFQTLANVLQAWRAFNERI